MREQPFRLAGTLPPSVAVLLRRTGAPPILPPLSPATCHLSPAVAQDGGKGVLAFPSPATCHVPAGSKLLSEDWSHAPGVWLALFSARPDQLIRSPIQIKRKHWRVGVWHLAFGVWGNGFGANQFGTRVTRPSDPPPRPRSLARRSVAKTARPRNVSPKPNLTPRRKDARAF